MGISVALLMLAACGEAKEGAGSGLDLRECVRGWQVLYSPPQVLDGLSPFRPKVEWQSGRIFFEGTDTSTGRTLLSLTPGGGGATTVLPDFGSDYWTEDGRVLFVKSGVLYQMPIPDGQSEPIAEPLVDSQVSENGSWVPGWALDSAALYWVSAPSISARDLSVWRAPRGAGGRRQIASLELGPSADTVDRFTAVAGGLLATSSGSAQVWQIPAEGGEAREFPRFGDTPAVIIGVSADGTILWSGGTKVHEVGRSRLDGLPVERLRTSVATDVAVTGAWFDEQGGFYLAADEQGSDGARHVTIWKLDAAGQGTRIACDPQIDSSMLGATAGPDGLYGVIRYSNLYWELVRITATRRS